MTVENLGESVQDAGGTEAPPSAAVSPEPEVQQTSLEADGTLEAALKRIDELEGMYRGLQSDKDRGTNKALKGVEDLSERFAEFEKYAKMRTDGKTEEQARREFVLDEVVQERLGTQVAQKGVGSPPVEPGWSEADRFLKEQGIDPNSAEVIEMVRQGKSRPEDYFAFALARKTKPVQPPNVAQVMPSGSGGVTTDRTLEVVTAELDAATTNPKGINLDLVKKLEAEHKALIPRK